MTNSIASLLYPYNLPIPLLGFAAHSGSGKTTLLKQLLPLLRQKKLSIAMCKHAHHDFDVDKPGKDSYELRKAGAEQMLIASSQRWALMVEKPDDSEPDFEALLKQINTQRADLILVEGFKRYPFAKIEVFREAAGHEPRYLNDPTIIAIATDKPFTNCDLAQFDLNQAEPIADFIMTLIKENPHD